MDSTDGSGEEDEHDVTREGDMDPPHDHEVVSGDLALQELSKQPSIR